MAKVSVIIPTYNRARYISAAVESVLVQSYHDVEIIVVDDGSTDNTADVLEAFGDRLIYLRQPHSGLPAAGRNAGLRAAAGKYVTFLDSDDLFLPDKLARQVARLEAEPREALVYSDAEYFTDDGTIVGTLLKNDPPAQERILVRLLVDNFLATCSVAVRRSCLATVGLFDESPEFAGVEDYELWLRIAARHPVGFVEGLSSRIRVHSDNISGGDKLAQYLGILAVLAKIERLYPDRLGKHRPILRERHALIHLAAARAYWRRRVWERAIEHLGSAVLANPNPAWLLYLVSTPHPAQNWLKRRSV